MIGKNRVSESMNAKNLKYQIELVDITKRFEKVIAVNNVSLSIKKGEFFSLLGPSGCGKTTTLRIIAGLENPTSGNVILDSKDVTNVPAYRRDVNTVFQDYAIFPHMSVYDNIYFPLKMRKISKKEARPKIERVLKLVNMSGFRYRYSNQLSGGQRQRIALARALVNEPQALLLDEPLGALDFKLRVAMQTALKDIQKDLGITFIYVTHDQTEAITMSDRIAVMQDGITYQIGTPDEIYNKPNTPFVASFIGKMNFLEGKVIKVSPKRIEVKISDFKVYCKKDEYKISEEEIVLVSVRPEKVYINSFKKLPNEIESKLTRIVFRGGDYEVTTAFGDFELLSVVDFKSWDKSHELGDIIKVGWELEDAKVFPIEMKKDIIKHGQWYQNNTI